VGRSTVKTVRHTDAPSSGGPNVMTVGVWDGLRGQPTWHMLAMIADTI
jgi:hypothetical protein